MFIAPTQIDIAIVGASCRLPGAKNRREFGEFISAGGCAVSSAPDGRWDVDRLLHPNPSMPGFAYTFAGGYLDNVFDFDPAVFGMSPREAMEADPQQRLLLETVYSALEDAWMPRSTLLGQDVGVYVGASSLDHGSIMAADPAAIDRYFMTGNTLSVISNRLSHNFDWHGPSFTVDTACSSSMVAFVQAMSDLSAGRVETAIVAGVNVLLNPMSFVGFSRASMLSPTGLCRPFSNKADGYVRGEGAVALVLRRGDSVVPGSARAWVVGGGLNNDGRTSGIALPSLDGQAALLDEVYAGIGVSPEQLAFVEAHGTGTQVGDAVEANALGTALGRKRSTPLPVGSVKSNLGHLEPASGVAGILKALHALDTRVLPRSLHLDGLNPHIDFAEIGIAPAGEPVALTADGPLYCGISSFGFGGTNAHIVLRSADPLPAPSVETPAAPQHLVVSAATREALAQVAGAYADLTDRGASIDAVARSVAQARDLHQYRAVISADETELGDNLRAFADGAAAPFVFEGTALTDARICFAFSGNGALTVELTRAAFSHNEIFRSNFRAVAKLFRVEMGSDLEHDLFFEDFEERKASAIFLQPLMFALQYSAAKAFVEEGLRPTMLLGHSFGEIAAACLAGAISVEDGAKIVAVRSTCQERLRGQGGMGVFSAGVDDMLSLIEATGLPSLEIAADNSPTSVTVTGEAADVKVLLAAGRKKRVAGRMLDLQYPFHSRLLDTLETELKSRLAGLTPRVAHTPMVSTVTGQPIGDQLLDADYWWQNFRQPVAFRQAVETASALGSNLFVEISQRPILVSAISQTLTALGADARAIPGFQSEGKDDDRDPVKDGLSRALANGATVGNAPVGPTFVDRRLELPHYAWQRRRYHFEETAQKLDIFGSGRTHPLIGERLFKGSQEWRVPLDSTLVPYLADHVVDGEVVVPGSAITEMMLAVGRSLHPTGALGVEDIDILQAMTLPQDSLREVCVRHTPATGMIEVLSRFHRSNGDWTLHARGRVAPVSALSAWTLPAAETFTPIDVDTVYRKALEAGMTYGPTFRRLTAVHRNHWTIRLELNPVDEPLDGSREPHIVHPATMDACFHALFHELDIDQSGGRRSYLPIRFGRVSVLRDHANVTSAVLKIETKTDQWLLVSVAMLDEAGIEVARLERVLLRSVVLSHGEDEPHLIVASLWPEADLSFDPAEMATVATVDSPEAEDAAALLEAHMRSLAYETLRPLCDRRRVLDLRAAIASGRLSSDAEAYAQALLGELAAAGMAQYRDEDDTWTLDARNALPESRRILATFVADYPSAAAEIMLAAGVSAGLADYLASGKSIVHRDTIVRQFLAGSLLMKPSMDGIERVITSAVDMAGAVRPRVVMLASRSEALLQTMAAFASRHAVRLAIAGASLAEARQCAQQLPADCPVQLIDLSDTRSVADAGRFDVALAGPSLRGADCESAAVSLDRLLVRRGLLVMAQAEPAGLLDVYFGTAPEWFLPMVTTGERLARPLAVDEVVASLRTSGFADVEGHAAAAGISSLIFARGGHDPVLDHSPIRVLHRERCTLASKLLSLLPQRNAGEADEDAQTIACLLRPGLAEEPDELKLMMELALDAAQDGAGRLWFVTSGVFGPGARPSSEAIWSYCRVLANEYPERDIHLLDLDPAADVADMASQIVATLAKGGAEREIHIDASGLRSVVRLTETTVPDDVGAGALTLKVAGGRGIADLHWQGVSRRPPGTGEVEMEVLATGLNFRDVMLAMGLLYDDVLDGGLAGAVLGFECSGRVLSVGPGVKTVSVGDLVCGVASEAFSTHVTAPAGNFIRIPEGVDAVQASTIPVAFLTAWYGLIELSRLRKGETVLIHGIGGGVGLAALQIAKARGAKVVGTVSTADKRALAMTLGADAVYDSRSVDFQEAVLRDHGGVDVVLNSLAGDAMRMSLKCLKPFGRFVELGKRDFIANTEIGLRPFRRNLSYFGVDVDQLMASHPDVAAEGLSYILKGFRSGKFHPLPHTVYRGAFTAEAMRVMQAAAHIGKIVICPPGVPAGDTAGETNVTSGARDGVHLIVGGTGGFGLATAAWLAQRGARQIVLASRSGRVAQEDAARLEECRSLGAEVIIHSMDVTDFAAVERTISKISNDVGPITAVYNAAAVLRDGFAAQVTADQMTAVLAPKVQGTVNLDRATRGQPIRDFVVFSSEAALVGNPGQATYAAANAFMHGVMRERRRDNLPALAVGWGPVSDVGMLARDAGVRRKLERATGSTGISSSEAHALLGQLLDHQAKLADPVLYFGRMRFQTIARDLPLVRAPAYSTLYRPDASAEAAADGDLLATITQKSPEEASAILCGIIVAEVATILRVAPTDVDVLQPLSSIGLDSLMALELRMSLESKFGFELPLMAITSVQNLKDLASRVLEMLQAPSSGTDEKADGLQDALYHMHVGAGAGSSEVAETIH